MVRYVVKNTETDGIKKSLKKWGEIPIRTDYLEGVVKIKNYRKYKMYEEVDAVFEGKIFVKVYREPRNWYSSSILKTHQISMVKLNRFLRRNCFFDIKTRMNYFGVEIKYFEYIKKIKWE
jgi:hypothetical protein